MLKKFIQSRWFYISLLVILTIPLGLFFFGARLIDGHDATAGLIRAISMDRYMGHGQFLVRWSPEINMGYGYPMFNFYPPFFSFVAVLFFQFTQNMILAINLACLMFWILSGIGMFLLAREFWGDEGGMLSALLYVYAPYHIIDLYVRGAFAEFSSFAFFPFLLFSILKISRKAGFGYYLLGIVSVFGLSLAHNIMSMLFFPVAFLFTLYLYFTGNKSKWIITGVSVFVIGLMMSSFFWLPALLEKEFLNLHFLIGKHYDFHENFISLRKLFWPLKVWTMDHISFQVGIIHTIFCLGTLIGLSRIIQIDKKAGRWYLFFLFISLASILFTLPCSHLFWEHISLLDYVQFPWRFLTIIVFAMSVLAGSIMVLIKNPIARKISLIIIGLVSIIFYLGSVPKPRFLNQEQSIESFIALGDGEYTPKWVTIPPDKPPLRKFEIIKGTAHLGQEKSLNPVHYETRLQSIDASLVCFHTFYFPGWKVYIDGQATQPFLNNPFGLIIFYVPPGDHDIQVSFGPTFVRLMSVIMSWFGVFLLLWVGTLKARFTVK